MNNYEETVNRYLKVRCFCSHRLVKAAGSLSACVTLVLLCWELLSQAGQGGNATVQERLHAWNAAPGALNPPSPFQRLVSLSFYHLAEVVVDQRRIKPAGWRRMDLHSCL